MKDSTIYKHPSYGVIGINRVSTRDKGLFMSDVTTNSYMELTIKTAEVDRHLHTDWVHGCNTLISVKLSPTQFAELLTSFNIGDGVPCTIDFVKGTGFIDYLPLPSKVDVIRKEAEEQIQSADEGISSAIDTLTQAAEGKGYLSKKQISDVISMLNSARYLYTNNNFAKKRAQEEIDNMVIQAKSQISAFVDHKIYSTGISALAQGFSAPKLVDGSSTEGEN